MTGLGADGVAGGGAAAGAAGAASASRLRTGPEVALDMSIVYVPGRVGYGGAVLTRRRRAPEIMDDPNVDRAQLARSLRFIRAVNRRLGGASAALGHLRRWSAEWPPESVIRVIDIGTGSADIPLAITRWARQSGRRVEITAVDNHPTTLALAREHVNEEPGIDRGVFHASKSDRISMISEPTGLSRRPNPVRSSKINSKILLILSKNQSSV